MEHVLVKHIQIIGVNHKPINRHPQAIGESHDGEGDNKGRSDGGDQDDEALRGEEVQEQPHGPDHEGLGSGLEVAEPVADGREDEGDEEEVRKTD